MCGIAGVVHSGGGRPDRAVLEAMVARLHHRGPDGRGVFIDGEAGLAHARLNIIDPVGGAQPMRTPDGELCLSYNGEIFNYVELKQELELEGVHFSTTSDTEVLLQCFARRGERCVQDLNGQWAYAVWDSRKREMLLSRDRVGINPLFYTVVDGTLIFASEIKAILEHPAVPRALDPQALDQIFTFWYPINGRTPFKGIHALPPGCNLRFRDGRVSIERYFGFDYRPGELEGSVDDLAQQLRELLIDATRIRLRADVPVGAYLSGGLDSSTTTAIVKHYTDNRLQTFSVAFEDPEFDEAGFQRQVSEHLGTIHHEVACSASLIGEVFPEVIWHGESPIIRTAPAPLFVLSGLVHQDDYRVVLTGEGADEMLGGYDIFKESKVRRFWGAVPESKWRPLLLQKLYPYLGNMQKLSPAYLQQFFHAQPEALQSPFFSHLPRWDMTSGLKMFFSEELRAELDGYDARQELLDSLPADFHSMHPFCQAQYLESTGLLPGYLLSSQGDRMLMGHSVEGRFPFLDHRVMDFAARLAPRMKMRGLDEKHILKRAFADLLPGPVLERPKQPYRAPDTVSFQTPGTGASQLEYVRELLGRPQLEAGGIFNADAVSRLVDKAARGGLTGIRDNMAFVAILSTQLVFKQFVQSFGDT